MNRVINIVSWSGSFKVNLSEIFRYVMASALGMSLSSCNSIDTSALINKQSSQNNSENNSSQNIVLPPAVVSIANPSADSIKDGPVSFDISIENASEVALSADFIQIASLSQIECSGLSVSGEGLLNRVVTVSNCVGIGEIQIVVLEGAAKNSQGISSEAVISSTVQVMNPSPRPSIALNLSLAAGQELSFDLSGRASGTPSSYQVVTAPPHGVLSSLGNGAYTYRSEKNIVGIEQARVRATYADTSTEDFVVSLAVNAYNFTGTWDLTGIGGSNPYSLVNNGGDMNCPNTSVIVSQSATLIEIEMRVYTGCRHNDTYRTRVPDFTIERRSFTVENGSLYQTINNVNTLVGSVGPSSINFSRCPSTGNCKRLSILSASPGVFQFSETSSIYRSDDYFVTGTLGNPH